MHPSPTNLGVRGVDTYMRYRLRGENVVWTPEEIRKNAGDELRRAAVDASESDGKTVIQDPDKTPPTGVREGDLIDLALGEQEEPSLSLPAFRTVNTPTGPEQVPPGYDDEPTEPGDETLINILREATIPPLHPRSSHAPSGRYNRKYTPAHAPVSGSVPGVRLRGIGKP